MAATTHCEIGKNQSRVRKIITSEFHNDKLVQQEDPKPTLHPRNDDIIQPKIHDGFSVQKEDPQLHDVPPDNSPQTGQVTHHPESDLPPKWKGTYQVIYEKNKISLEGTTAEDAFMGIKVDTGANRRSIMSSKHYAAYCELFRQKHTIRPQKEKKVKGVEGLNKSIGEARIQIPFRGL